MSLIDWIIMLGTLFTIVIYGAWKTRKNKSIEGFLLGGKTNKGWAIGLSVMATQASAITFLSTPGQAYESGMDFIQFYFGLPLAMIIISVVFIPLFYRLKVYTAYEFLESRFDRKMRVFTAILFLLQRGLAAGITIYAPAIILSQILNWPLLFTIIFIGVLVIIYTVSGGTRAVTQTHKQQMAVIFTGMFIAFGALIWYITRHVSFGNALQIAGEMGKMEVIDLEFDLNNRYTLWTGLIGGLFLQLSYFGTDQSQVQRYLTGKGTKESRLGLMFNGIFKIPMQFFILFTGVLVFVFYQFYEQPVHFNNISLEKAEQSEYREELSTLKGEYRTVHEEKKEVLYDLAAALDKNDNEQASLLAGEAKSLEGKMGDIRGSVDAVIKKANPLNKSEDDTDYVFITFVMNYLPIGLIGLLIAVIFSAAMSSTSAELNALTSTTTVDIYQRNFKRQGSEKHYLLASRLFTVLFGVLAITFAYLADLFENLIEAVNILGSLFYGTILGIFLVAFFQKKTGANAVFIAALVAEATVILLFNFSEIGYLWFNFIGCAIVFVLAFIFSLFKMK